MKKKEPLSIRLQGVLDRAPEGWDRSVVLTEDRGLDSTTVTLMDVRYVWSEGEVADVERVMVKELLARVLLEDAVSPDEFYGLLLETMADDLVEEHSKPRPPRSRPEPEGERSPFLVLYFLAVACFLLAWLLPSDGATVAFTALGAAVSGWAALSVWEAWRASR